MARSVRLSAPWVISLHGQFLPSFAPYDTLVTDEEVPSASRTPHWSLKAHATVLDQIPEGRDVLWESVLALYRLQMVESRGKVWQDYCTRTTKRATAIAENADKRAANPVMTDCHRGNRQPSG